MENNKIKGGKADKLTPQDLARKHYMFIGTIEKEIELGLKIEKEHTSDKDEALEIVMDHLTEFPDYYSNEEHGLLAMEKKLEKDNKDRLNPPKKASNKEIEKKVTELLKKHKDGKIPDKLVHKLADELGLSSHDLEPFFYKLAAKQVNSNESALKRLANIIKEEIGLTVTDEAPSELTYQIMSDDVVAGEISVKTNHPDLGKDSLEIVGFKMDPKYQTMKLAFDAVKSLWVAHENANKMVVSPADEAVQFWTKLGFTRLNNDYYILLRGH